MKLKTFVGVSCTFGMYVTSTYSSIFCCKMIDKYFNCTVFIACNKSNFYDSVQDAIESLVFMPYLCVQLLLM